MSKPQTPRPSRGRPDPRPIDWEQVTDEELLAKRICDLPLKIEGTVLEEWVRTVYRELETKGIGFHPEVYLGDEWFSPEGDPIISIPYYLAHPRLIKLERSRVLEAEGESREWFLKLLRHEMGHALSHAYGLGRSKGYRSVFGDPAQEYPDGFRPRPYSRKYVQHLFDWYAQLHPDEDYAETFAVWLTPDKDWRREYASWPALRKLEFVDRLMGGIRGRRPKKSRAPKWRHLRSIRMTIAYSHKLKRRAMEEDFPDYFDRDLLAIFASGGEAEKAGCFLRRHRKELVRSIAQWTLAKKYTVNELVTRLAERADELALRVARPELTTLTRVSVCLTAMAKNYFLTGKFKRRV
ncbi:MAG: putative zinc-binding metallopeptidase [Elusimicrobiota bacterium]